MLHTPTHAAINLETMAADGWELIELFDAPTQHMEDPRPRMSAHLAQEAPHARLLACRHGRLAAELLLSTGAADEAVAAAAPAMESAADTAAAAARRTE